LIVKGRAILKASYKSIGKEMIYALGDVLEFLGNQCHSREESDAITKEIALRFARDAVFTPYRHCGKLLDA